jgi:hypothetical protein
METAHSGRYESTWKANLLEELLKQHDQFQARAL